MELTEKQIEEALEWEATVTRVRRELIERMDEQGNRVNLKAREPQGPEILAAAYRAEHERAERLAKALADAATALARSREAGGTHRPGVQTMTDRLRELLERAMPLIYLVRWSADPAMGGRAVELLGEIKRAVGEPEACEWTRVAGYFVSACDDRGRVYPLSWPEPRDRLGWDDPRCPGCGRLIKIREVSGGTT